MGRGLGEGNQQKRFSSSIKQKDILKIILKKYIMLSLDNIVAKT